MNDLSKIDDEELLYRKVSVNSSWYDPDKKDLKPDAFQPRKDDTQGISFDRAKSSSYPGFRSIEQAAVGRSPQGYYVAIFRVGDLRFQGMTIVADCIDGNAGHALLVDLTYLNRKDPVAEGIKVKLAHKLVRNVEGPFPSLIDDQG